MQSVSSCRAGACTMKVNLRGGGRARGGGGAGADGQAPLRLDTCRPAGQLPPHSQPPPTHFSFQVGVSVRLATAVRSLRFSRSHSWQ